MRKTKCKTAVTAPLSTNHEQLINLQVSKEAITYIILYFLRCG
jgi:hypothetical protein